MTEPEANQPLLLALPEVARLLGVSDRQCRRWIGDDKIGTVKMGRRVLVHRAEVERLAREGVQ